MRTLNIKTVSMFSVCIMVVLSSCYKKFDPATYAPALSIGGYTSPDEISPSNLIAYWPFNGDFTDQISKTSGENTGESFTGGIKGQALKGALNSYVLFTPTDAIKSMKSFTITYWVNSPLNTNGIVGMVNLANINGFWANIDMFFENGGDATTAKIKVHTTSNGKDNWIGPIDAKNIWNVWTAIAYKYDGATSTGTLYVNGSVASSAVSDGMGDLNYSDVGKMVFGCVQFQTTPSLTTATGSQPWASYLTGALDEVRIYNAALSDSDISSLVKLEGRGK